jgi:hypothetical protein
MSFTISELNREQNIKLLQSNVTCDVLVEMCRFFICTNVFHFGYILFFWWMLTTILIFASPIHMLYQDCTFIKLFQNIANKGLLKHTEMQVSWKQLLITKGIEQISLLIDLNLNLHSKWKMKKYWNFGYVHCTKKMLENILLNWPSIFIVLQCQLDNSKLLKMGRGHTTSILLGDNNCDLHCLNK